MPTISPTFEPTFSPTISLEPTTSSQPSPLFGLLPATPAPTTISPSHSPTKRHPIFSGKSSKKGKSSKTPKIPSSQASAKSGKASAKSSKANYIAKAAKSSASSSKSSKSSYSTVAHASASDYDNGNNSISKVTQGLTTGAVVKSSGNRISRHLLATSAAAFVLGIFPLM
mmetsp:Transcript_12756/g.26835  ORF Transcript_12756/g.26835 Transcript_12756/m.26835 type:complete len:170 (-) Transcript_12756:657-1166(-)